MILSYHIHIVRASMQVTMSARMRLVVVWVHPRVPSRIDNAGRNVKRASLSAATSAPDGLEPDISFVAASESIAKYAGSLTLMQSSQPWSSSGPSDTGQGRELRGTSAINMIWDQKGQNTQRTASRSSGRVESTCATTSRHSARTALPIENESWCLVLGQLLQLCVWPVFDTRRPSTRRPGETMVPSPTDVR
jgi:hypothetical protein